MVLEVVDDVSPARRAIYRRTNRRRFMKEGRAARQLNVAIMLAEIWQPQRRRKLRRDLTRERRAEAL